MFDKLKAFALSAMIGLGGVAAVPAAAQADGLYFNLGGNGDARFGVYAGDRHAPRWDRKRARCSPQRAVQKAKRMGLRHAKVRRVTRNRINITGRDRGDRVMVTFGRGRNCPVLRFR